MSFLEPEGGRPLISIDTQGGQVVLQFDRTTQWVGLEPQKAVELADAIVRAAMRLAPESKIILPH